MRNAFLILKLIIIFFISFSSRDINAQLGFCQGNSGDPIFTETFGVGTTYGPQLPAGTTTYNFVGFNGPQDGEYTIGSNTFSYGWNLPSDHTIGDTNGKCLIVNANSIAEEFYKTSVSGLCENTTYEFSSWLINILPSSGCSGNGVPVNVKFEIWDITDTSLLASGNTGNIFSSAVPTWLQYGLVFQTLPSQTAIILKMINNAPNTNPCGNDLAIDDITFKSCGDLIDSQDSSGSDSVAICSSQSPYSDTITAIPDFAVFSNHFYQWQESTDGLNWTDVVSETNASISFTGITTTTYYRAKVAEFAANLNNSDCITFSDIYQINITQAPPPPTIECWETATLNDTTCSWMVTGTQPVAPTGLECWQIAIFNSTTCVWDVTGTQPQQPTGLECWEVAAFNDTTCTWEVTGTQPEAPTDLECGETAAFNSTTCIWDVTSNQPAAPTVECWETAIFNNTTCLWEVTGVQPQLPTLECWQIATFNSTTCVWDVTGTQPQQPTGLECWEVAAFNDTTCTWEVTGTQPEAPTDLECGETAAFNSTTCIWDVTSNQPAAPTVECWETAIFNNTTCLWEVTGVQPQLPTLECWQIATFNSTTCVWDVTGTQPQQPTGLECWEIAIFIDMTCAWEVSGSQPEAPTGLECWQSVTFNNVLCSWEIEGTEPEEPTDVECWELATYNNTTCAWEITGLQPVEPIDLFCWQTTEFNEDLCEWEIFGTQPIESRNEFLYLCEDEFLMLEAESFIENPTSYSWSTDEITESITVENAGSYQVEVTDGCSTEIITFNVTQIENPVIESVVSDGSSIIINISSVGDYLFSLDGVDYQFSNVFSNVSSGLYTVYVKSGLCDIVVTQEYLHFFIPKFFTPNGDGFNDSFTINALEYFTSTEVYIFDRYGKLLFSAKNRNVNWDGTFNNSKLPSSDYWYRIVIDGLEFKGHFTLKR